ncbi:MAG TPA: NAD(P)-dependent oxidoreductase [Myxococcota bacterium]|nr:NAD(P)-dependent oxidoreductase [Myxococcota bacterium]
MTPETEHLGFIGLGVMGEPICRNLALKTKRHVVAHDLDPAPLERLAAHGVRSGGSVRSVVESADVVFLSLPSGEVVDELAHAADGLLTAIRAGQTVVDLSTSPVHTTRRLAQEFAAAGARFVDAPVARTRAAAEAGTLAVMVGAEPDVFLELKPLIAAFATDITLCGPVGCGQVLKILNNVLLFQNVVALCEAKAIGERLGVSARVLFDALASGSADSFALRSHGMKAVLPDDYPLKAFSVRYALKDLRYARLLGEQAGIELDGAKRVEDLLDAAIEAGFGERYWPVVSRLLERRRG